MFLRDEQEGTYVSYLYSFRIFVRDWSDLAAAPLTNDFRESHPGETSSTAAE